MKVEKEDIEMLKKVGQYLWTQDKCDYNNAVLSLINRMKADLENPHEFKVGDRVRVVGATDTEDFGRHDFCIGDEVEIIGDFTTVKSYPCRSPLIGISYVLHSDLEPLNDGVEDAFNKAGYKAKEYTADEMIAPSPKKLPEGLMPRMLWRSDRRNEILEAMARYIAADKEVPKEWVLEFKQIDEL